MRLAHLRNTGACGKPPIGATWDRVARIPGPPPGSNLFLGIAQDVPEITPVPKCRYDGRVALPSDAPAVERYAVLAQEVSRPGAFHCRLYGPLQPWRR